MIKEIEPVQKVRPDGTPREAGDIRWNQQVNVLRRSLEVMSEGAKHDVRVARQIGGPVAEAVVSLATWGLRNNLWAKPEASAGRAKAETPNR